MSAERGRDTRRDEVTTGPGALRRTRGRLLISARSVFRWSCWLERVAQPIGYAWFIGLVRSMNSVSQNGPLVFDGQLGLIKGAIRTVLLADHFKSWLVEQGRA